MYVYLLSGDYPDIGAAEIKALTQTEGRLKKQLFFCPKLVQQPERLAYTKKVYKLLFQSSEREHKKKVQEFNWESLYKKNYAVRAHQTQAREKDIASWIWYKLKAPVVNLKKPKTVFEFLNQEKTVYALHLIYEQREHFQTRRAHLRPGMHPSSLHPKLARALINLTGIQEGVILDPFCGTGGILIEAALLGFKPRGHDLSPDMLKKAKKNLNHFKIKDYELSKLDATRLSEKIDYVVTDLPYGRNTASQDMQKLYTIFLTTLKKVLKKRAVIVFPATVKKKLIKDTGLTIEGEFTYYLHKTLSKKMYILS